MKYKIWLNGSLVERDKAKISILSPSFNYGANVFEGIRAYWNNEKKTLNIFRLNDHLDRLIESADSFGFKKIYSKSKLKEAILQTIQENKIKQDISIRQTIYADGSGNWSSSGPTGMFVSIINKERSLYKKSHLNCLVSNWERINENSMPPSIKVGANYINGRYAYLDAKKRGYDYPLLLDKNGYVSDGPGACFFLIKNGRLITPPLSASILNIFANIE